MSSIKGTGRSTGLLYLIMGLPAPFALLYIPTHFIVKNDPQATAARIVAEESIYRLGVMADLISAVGFLVLVLSLYRLFKNVDRAQARAMVAFVLVASAIGFIDVTLMSSSLVFAKTEPGLALTFARIRSTELNIANTLWGLWLFPFGILVMRSGFMPKFIGYFLILGGFCYVINAVTFVLAPQYLNVVTNVTLPLGGPGEILAMGWLLIKGGDVPFASETGEYRQETLSRQAA